MRTRRVAIAVLLAAALLLVVVWRSAPPTPEVRAGAVTEGDLVARFLGTGEVTVKKAALAPPDWAIIRAVDVKENDAVKAGQRVAQLDASGMRARFYDARAAFEAARGKLLEANRYRNLRAAQLDLDVRRSPEQAKVRELELQMLTEKIQNAQMEMRVRGAELKEAEGALLSADLRSPIDGKVAQVLVVAGERAGPGQPVVTVVGTAPPWVEANVDEQDAAWVSVGQTVKVHVAALPGQVLDGTVEWVAPSLEATTRANQSGKMLHVRVRLANPPDTLRSGMAVDVDGQAVLAKQARLLPRAAVQLTREGPTVLVVQGGRVKRVPVRLGPSSADQVQMLDGPPTGTSLVLEGGDRLADGERVRVLP